MGLAHASASVFLSLRFGIALAVLSLLALARGHWWPRRSPGRVALTGALLVGGYSVFYLLALDFGMTPGLLATLLGVQPIATPVLTERPLRRSRPGGLLLALLPVSELRLQWSTGLFVTVGWLALPVLPRAGGNGGAGLAGVREHDGAGGAPGSGRDRDRGGVGVSLLVSGFGAARAHPDLRREDAANRRSG